MQKTISKTDIIGLVEAEIQKENQSYEKHMINNPTDEQRTHDNAVIKSVLTGLLYEINKKF